MNPWMALVAGGFFEMCWALVMNLSDGFVKVEWGIAAYLISLIEIFFLAILIGGILLLQLQEGSGDGEEAQRDQ